MDTEVGEMRVAMNWEFGVDTHTLCVCAQLLSHVLLFVVDYNPPRSSVHGVFQARILEQVAMYYSRGPDKGLRPCPALRVDSLPPRAWEGRVGICGTAQGTQPGARC